MFAAIIHTVQVWWCTQRAFREPSPLDDQSLEDIGPDPYETPDRRIQF